MTFISGLEKNDSKIHMETQIMKTILNNKTKLDAT